MTLTGPWPVAAAVGKTLAKILPGRHSETTSSRPGRPSFALIPLGGHRFAVESTPAMRMLFDASGKTAKAMTVEYAGGPVQPRVKRTPAR